MFGIGSGSVFKLRRHSTKVNFLHILVYLVIYGSGQVSLENLLLSWCPSPTEKNETLANVECAFLLADLPEKKSWGEFPVRELEWIRPNTLNNTTP